MFKQGFVPLDRLLKPAPNFNRGRRIKIFLNLKKLKKTEASNVISGISFPPGFFGLYREKFDILLLGRFSIFSDYRFFLLNTIYECFTMIDVNELRNMS